MLVFREDEPGIDGTVASATSRERLLPIRCQWESHGLPLDDLHVQQLIATSRE